MEVLNKNRLRHNTTKKKKCHYDAVIPITAIIITCTIMTVPVIFFYVSKSTSIVGDLDLTNQESETVNLTGCTSLSWGEHQLTSRNQCTNALYEGTICKDVLETWKRCATNSNENGQLYVHVNGSLDSREKEIIDLNTYLIHDTECQKVALPFLCQYQFPLQYCSSTASSSSGGAGSIIYTSTREDCIDISTGVCAQLWSLALQLGYGDQLPNCNSLPARSAIFNNSQEEVNSSNATQITCREDFIVSSNSTCIPSCDRFQENTHTGTLYLIYSERISSLIALILSLFIFIISIKSYKEMFVYPSILILFEIIDCCIIASLVFIISINRVKLMCTPDDSLLHSLDNPTTFCTISGALFHFAMVNMSSLWLFHVCIFFHRVVFPFHANRTTRLGRDKYIFVIVTLLSILLPLPAIIVCLSVDKYKYKIARFPTSICISQGDMWFYSVTLVIDTMVCTGMCLLIIVFWILHKRNGLRTQLSTAEKKIIIIFLSFLVFTITSLAQVSEISAKSEKFTAAISYYFQCEAFGYVPGKCQRIYEGIFSPFVTSIIYTLVGCIPIGVLNYVLKWEWVKNGNKSFKRSIRTWREQNISLNSQKSSSHHGSTVILTVNRSAVTKNGIKTNGSNGVNKLSNGISNGMVLNSNGGSLCNGHSQINSNGFQCNNSDVMITDNKTVSQDDTV